MTAVYTTKHQVVGQVVDFTFSKLSTGATADTRWEDFSIDIEGKEFPARSASSPVFQGDVYPDRLTGSANGFVGDGNSLPQLPQVGDVLLTFSALTITEGADLIGTITAFGSIKVTKCNYKQGVEAGKWSFEFKSYGYTTMAATSFAQ